MHKLTLDCDTLEVDSFPTQHEGEDGDGTVRGYMDWKTVKIVCDVGTVKTDPTCCPCTP